ncbi:lantibiotic dehydratase [Nocardioides speluncae]|uniref:lantibiotic dehydratase n=1 Tax=Nocardioides speluncae TaxID=2670337 RepID=UPI000D686BB8|nr:lantibiotic dehydratase [Nocardioides speluncae]
MSDQRPEPLYRHLGVGLLRGARLSKDAGPSWWPDLTDPFECRRWLAEFGATADIAGAVQHASPSLARQIERIGRGNPVAEKNLLRIALSLVRYHLRATGRCTPFGLFAGVAAAAVADSAKVRWGDGHQAMIAPDAEWLLGVVQRLERCPALLDRLEVVFNDLAVRRGGRLEWPRGSGRVTIQYTPAVRAVGEAAASPVRFDELVDHLGALFPGADEQEIRAMLAILVAQGFLITNLRAPMTETDQLGHVLSRLRDVNAEAVAPVASTYRTLDQIAADVARHNNPATAPTEAIRIREVLPDRMAPLSEDGRTPLALDLRLDCEVHLPTSVAEEVELAATALARLTRQPTGEAVWREYFTAFCDRYGINALVPLSCVVHPETGLGLPATYPGSVIRSPAVPASERDAKLLALAWQALADGTDEVVLTDDTIRALAVGDPDTDPTTPPHVEMSARLQAASVDDLERGDYLIFVQPARAAGTLTSRHQHLLEGEGWRGAYRQLPAATEGALRVQLTFPPNFPRSENICRVPAYLPQVLSLGEHRHYDETTVAPGDLAVMATNDNLHLVSISRRQVIEPEVFHALALESQPPALARFLAHITQANRASWHRFDWGQQAADMPYLPRVRYRRSILAPSRWRLTSSDLPPDLDAAAWQVHLARWRARWRCPEGVELVDEDRSLPLTLGQQSHAAILQAHLAQHGHAVLHETITPDGLGWIDGHAHDLVLPLASTSRPVASPLSGRQPLITNRRHGQIPGTPESRWLFAKVFTHPERMDEILGDHLPTLLDRLDEPDFWFARYRSAHEADHLRLRLRAAHGQGPLLIAAVGEWVQHLREHCLAGRLVIDTYQPETGRYGDGPAMVAAEGVFAADSRVVAAQLGQQSGQLIDPQVLAALNAVATVTGLLGSTQDAVDWLIARPPPALTAPVERALADQVVDAVLRQSSASPTSAWPRQVVSAWDNRSRTLAAYRDHLSDEDVDRVLDALLHMHHNRALGIDRRGEATCRALARRAALAMGARRDRGHP